MARDFKIRPTVNGEGVALLGDIRAVVAGTLEVDVCSEGFKESGTFDITGLTGLDTEDEVKVWQTPGPYTGKGTLTDDPEMDMLVVSANVVDATTIRCYWFAIGGAVRGNFKFAYLVINLGG